VQKRFKKWPAALLAGSFLTAALAVSSLVSTTHAQQRARFASQEGASGFTLEGKISKVEAGKFTVSTEENIIFHVSYNDKTEIKHQDGSPATSKEIRVGAHVKAAGEFTESGEIAAKTIEIEPAADSKTQNSPK
jgi:hypothetical protein